MRQRILYATTIAVALTLLFALPVGSTAQDAPAADAASAGEAAASEENRIPLSTRQEGLSRRYRDFENTLLQMYEYMRKTDPEKADLLLRAIAKSKDQRIAAQMQQIVALLDQKQFGNAVERQDELVIQLEALLELLQSEDRFKTLEAEKARIQDLLKDLGRIMGKQMDTRAKTERGEDPKKLAERQGDVEGDTQKLVKKIDGQDAERAAENQDGKGKPNEGQPGEGEPKPSEGEQPPGEEEPKPGEAKPGEGEPKPGEQKPGEGDPGEGKPGESKPGESKPSESKPGENKPGEGTPGEGKPGEGQSSEQQSDESQSSQDSNRTPGREELEQARQEMERAIEELKKADRDGASDAQDKAIAKLREAKAKLEEILRQLREEERELILAALEARFQKMLALQLIVYNGTSSLDKTPKNEWTSRHFGRSRELSQQEDEIALEAGKALTLLQAEGSSIAFPEAVEQLREDMLLVARRLEREDVGEITQGIERDIIEALEEMIEALQKEIEKMKEQQQQQQQQQSQPQDQALVDRLAELKMLRSLQYRVNRRTKQLSRLIEGEQAVEPDVVQQLQSLARRQQRIQETTYGLATGRNE